MLIAVLALAAAILWILTFAIPFREPLLRWLDRRFGR